MTLWDRFRIAMEAHQQKPSEASAANAITAYSSWCADFVPEHAEGLVSDLRDRLSAKRSAA